MPTKVREPQNYYTANEDLKFIFEKMLDWDKLLPLMPEGDLDVYKMTLETAGKLAGSKLAQRITENDRKGSHYNPQTGKVEWAEGFEEGFKELKEAGLLCLPIHEEGGPGLPLSVSMAVTEMVSRADPSMMTKYGLIEGVAEMIETFGSEELKKEYLPKLISGEYTASMDLTEAEAGSDLGGVTTRAIEKDGKIYIEGTKIFITTCDSDVHLALVRDEDTFKETKGTTKGLSIYLVPKTLKDGTPNKISVSKTEEKLGITASATGVVNYDMAEGYLVGQKGNGMKQMLRLMFGARLGVAAQSVGIAEASYQEAKEYASVRKQFGTEIINQPLVADMLAKMRMSIEGARALVYETSFAVDMERMLEKKIKKEGETPELKKEYEKYRAKARVLTPLVKYFASEECIKIARLAIQIHGGVGFTKEYLVEQFLRDSIITTIYEGTSEIQVSMAAADLLRGLFAGEIAEVRAYLANVSEEMKPYADKVKIMLDKFENCSGKLTSDYFSTQNDSYVRLRAKEFCEMIIDAYISYLFLKQAEKSERKKIMAKLFIDRALPRVEMNEKYIESMDKTLLSVKDQII